MFRGDSLVLSVTGVLALTALTACGDTSELSVELEDGGIETGADLDGDVAELVVDAGTQDAAEPDSGLPFDVAMPTDMAGPTPDMGTPAPDVAPPPPPDMAPPPPPDMAPPPPPDMAPPDVAPPPPWWSVDANARSVVTNALRYNYAYGWLHGDMTKLYSHGVAIRGFRGPSGEDHSLGMDAPWLGDKWDPMQVTFTAVTPVGDDRLDITVKTGSTRKIERLHKGWGGVEIEYLEITAAELEDYVTIDDQGMYDTTMVMYGMKDIVGRYNGQKIWEKSIELAKARYNIEFSTGDTFIEANGSTVNDCKYKGHFIYGAVNPRNGRGVGFVWPASVWDVKELHFLFAEDKRLEYWWFPKGKTAKRWMYTVTGGKDELLRVGKALVDNGGYKP